jgi:hypothetical protein
LINLARLQLLLPKDFDRYIRVLDAQTWEIGIAGAHLLLLAEKVQCPRPMILKCAEPLPRIPFNLKPEDLKTDQVSVMADPKTDQGFYCLQRPVGRNGVVTCANT